MEEQNPEPQATDSHSDLITAFSEITSSTKQEALFFLESHNFDLDSAVSTFFESTTTAAVAADPAVAQPRPSPSSSPSASPVSSSPSRSRSVSPPPSLGLQHYNLRSRNTNRAEEKKPKKPQPSTRAGGIRTISDLNRPVKEDDDDDDDDDSDGDYDPPQEYYTGGEKSGMLVQDPSRVNDIDALFRQAKQHAAEEGSMDHLQPSSSRSFSGRGRTLSGETVSAAPQQPDPLTRTITFWTNGFTIDDGPLRRFDDPANASFLQSIAKSECPEELKSASRSGAVHVKLVRKLEDYKVPQRRNNPFQGVGRTLGDTVTEEATAPPPAPTVLSSAPTPSVGLVVDQTLPSTSIQLRLVDGTRMVSRFNYHHTINDIRSFIDASRPGGQRAYQLLTMGFPPKQLTDLNQTIEQAGLANSVVIQKF